MTAAPRTHPLASGLAPSWAWGWGKDRFGVFAEIRVGEVVHRLRWICPGSFKMGSPEEEAGRWGDEGPRHEVTLTCGYWLGEVPCTQALWEAVMGENPSRFRSPGRPVEQVSWEDCQGFFAALARRVPGFVGRLPTEAQWEYACRAETGTATWLGDLEILGERNAPLLDAIAWYGGNSGVGFDLDQGEDSTIWPKKQHSQERGGTRRVGRKAPNPWGLYDMLGNVWEWCEDRWAGRGYPGGDRLDPVGEEGSGRVLRGGSWLDRAGRVRAAARVGLQPYPRHASLGFRVSGSSQEEQRAESSGGAPGGRSGGPAARDAPPAGIPMSDGVVVGSDPRASGSA